MTKINKKSRKIVPSGITNQMLYPNCSEVTWRLDLPEKRTTKEKIIDTLMEVDIENESETDTASYQNYCVETMIDIIKDAKKQGIDPEEIELTLTDNVGGGGDPDFVESCFAIALEHAKGKITKRQAEAKEEKLWNGEEDIDPDG
jgi:hypothetical protein